MSGLFFLKCFEVRPDCTQWIFFLVNIRAKCNYDVANWEHLTVKLALKEILVYIKTAKCQAWWALLFTKFNNVTADFLAHMHPKETAKEPILPRICFVGVIIWETKREIKSTPTTKIPEKCHAGRKSVPPNLRAWVISWASKSPASLWTGIGLF